MNGKYDQPTAHMLQPTKGWDSMAHLDYTAPINTAKVQDAYSGTVMHLNNRGQLETGLTAQGMGMFLFYKQNDEDTLNPPVTADGSRITSISMNSFGGYNSEEYLRGFAYDGSTTFDSRNGGASNLPSYQAYMSTSHYANGSSDATHAYVYQEAQSAHLTYPAICGMELSSTEFAVKKGANGATSINMNTDYAPNTCLTSPVCGEDRFSTTGLAATASAASADTGYGTTAQKVCGGYLQPAVPYKDPVCGIVSRGTINQNGYPQIYFWATWLPALATTAPTAANQKLTYNGTDRLVWQS